MAAEAEGVLAVLVKKQNVFTIVTKFSVPVRIEEPRRKDATAINTIIVFFAHSFSLTGKTIYPFILSSLTPTGFALRRNRIRSGGGVWPPPSG